MPSISACRLCRGTKLVNVLDFGNVAFTGVFPQNAKEEIPFGKLNVLFCEDCSLAQLGESFPADELYGDNYGYRSGLNKSMVTHLETTVKRLENIRELSPGDIVCDIGSNDATLLNSYQINGIQKIGIDPTISKYGDFYRNDTIPVADFFSASTYFENLEKKAQVVTSIAMFYDLEDPVAFAKDIHSILDHDGIWHFEQSYTPWVLRTGSFDTICHEHLEFYGLKQIQHIAKIANLKVLDVTFNEVNGGSFSIIVAKIDSEHQSNTVRIEQILAEEQSLGLNGIEVFNEFRVQVAEAGKALSTFLEKAKSKGERVCGLGASTKGNVLLQYFNIDASLLPVIGEVNSEKFGKFTPGSLIPMLSEDDVLETKPDYLLVLPWHFRKFFVSHSKLKGQRLVFPLPKFEVVQL